MKSHRLDTFTFLGPKGFTVEGTCACGHKICQGPTLQYQEAVMALQATHNDHVIQVLERVWLEGVAR